VKLETEAFVPNLYNPVRLSAFHLLIEERLKKEEKITESVVATGKGAKRSKTIPLERGQTCINRR